MPEQVQEQDLGVSRPHGGDRQWARSRPIAIIPTKERLDLPSQTVSVKNTSPNQKHNVASCSCCDQSLAKGVDALLFGLRKQRRIFPERVVGNDATKFQT